MEGGSRVRGKPLEAFIIIFSKKVFKNAGTE